MEANPESSNSSAQVGDSYGYQLYKDNTDTTYCSSKKLKSHAEGNAWIKKCLTAHAGTSVSGKPWTSQSQAGTVWP